MKQVLDTTDLQFTPGVAGVGTIRFLRADVSIENVQLVTNVTRGVVVYQFNSATRGSAGFDAATKTLTLDLDTSTHSANDVLQAVVDTTEDIENRSFPIYASDEQRNPTRIRSNLHGHLMLADNVSITGSRAGLGTVFVAETTGYNSIVVQLFNGFGTINWTCSFQVSNDGTTWSAVAGWPVSGAAAPVSTANAAGQWVFPTAGRFFRVQCTTFTSGLPTAFAVLKSLPGFFPFSSLSVTPTANAAINVSQIGGTALVNGGVAGIQAIGGNIAVGTAPTANPVPIGGWDGTATRRLLTDAVNGGLVLGSSAVGNGQTIVRYNQTATTPASFTVKGSSGRLTMLNISNNSTVAGFLHLYNVASLILGLTSDVLCFAIPANVTTFPIVLPEGGLFFSAAIHGAFTAGGAAADNTNFGTAPNLTANLSFV